MVSPGDKLKIRAADWNGFQEMLRWWRKHGGMFGGDTGRMFTAPIQIKNTTASDVSAFGVLAIDAPIIDLSANTGIRFQGIAFDGIAPSTTTPHYGKFAVLQEPAKANGGFARAVIAGETLVKLNIADADDVACDIENNQTGYLTTSMHGSARIIWKSSGTGSSDKWGLVRLGDGPRLLLGILTSVLAEGGSATVNLYSHNGSDWEATGNTVTAYDFFLGPGDSWPVSTRVLLSWMETLWVVIQASCDPDSGGGGGGGGGGATNSGSHLGGGTGGIYPSGYDGGGDDFSGSTDWRDYDSLFNSA